MAAKDTPSNMALNRSEEFVRVIINPDNTTSKADQLMAYVVLYSLYLNNHSIKILPPIISSSADILI